MVSMQEVSQVNCITSIYDLVLNWPDFLKQFSGLILENKGMCAV